jgi:hypothetical protein
MVAVAPDVSPVIVSPFVNLPIEPSSNPRPDSVIILFASTILFASVSIESSNKINCSVFVS